jgi:proline racemase
MKAIKSIHAIDSHTMGEPTRIIVGGVPHVPGKTMAEKKYFLEKNMDNLRTTLMLEPRGHRDMFGSILTPPVNEEADFGIIFMDGGGYLNMCCHGAIGAVTVAIETGMVAMKAPVVDVVMDTPAGIIKSSARVENEKVKEVSIINVPSFHYRKDVEIEIFEIGKISVDIAFGGSFFAIVDAKHLGLKVAPGNARKLTEIGLKIRDAVNRTLEIKHPTLDHIRTVDLVEIYDEPTDPKTTYKNVVVFGQGQVDRSPCGTGTSAKLATLYSKGRINKGDLFVYESILGTSFKGRIVEITQVGEYEAIIPEITGAAYITGFNHFVIDPDDPLKYGFVL